MNSINLFSLTRIVNNNLFVKYEKKLSGRKCDLAIRDWERKSLVDFVEIMLNNGAQYRDLGKFYYSYEIPQIGKEFDLLRIDDNLVINIELKSQYVDEEKIKSQLISNRYYLSHLGKPLFQFAYISGDDKIYRLVDNSVTKDSIHSVIKLLGSMANCYNTDINSLFRVSDFLVSPLNTPTKFLSKEYFLTSQQQDFKKKSNRYLPILILTF
ncbi:hypothetical protein [Youngiibacter multivorans]|uniref:GxxExxY protein n=1 Tax=Youngiibacter multivorans TaxID=937251 RepID=A0ABS4G6Y0_9CLOT|nr:hypothetical protein [Youngiibacter multivorans]MBP1920289.1 hypothetical protein [Youngiibacter multivorans]